MSDAETTKAVEAVASRLIGWSKARTRRMADEVIKMATERDTKCAFCRKEVPKDEPWISFGNASLLGKEAVDLMCVGCLVDAVHELDQYREASRVLEAGIPPFEESR